MPWLAVMKVLYKVLANVIELNLEDRVGVGVRSPTGAGPHARERYVRPFAGAGVGN